MGDKPAVDRSQLFKFFQCFYREHDRFFVYVGKEKSAEALYSEELLQKLKKYGGGWHLRVDRESKPGWFYLADKWLMSPCIVEMEKLNAGKKMQVAASVMTFSNTGSRREPEVVHAGGFVVDVDTAQFEKISTATTKRDVMRAAVAILEQRGLRPHAIVDSGRGFHVYVLIEHQEMVTEAERARLKHLWRQLGTVLGGATDRHDLSSVVRLPGTINWKGGTAKQTGFVYDICDFDRPRYRLAALEAALADVQDRQPTASKTVRRSTSVDMPSHDVDADPLLKLALAADDDLFAALLHSRDPKARDRSGADHYLGCRMFELGLPESFINRVLLTTDKAVEVSNPDDYVRRTLESCRKQALKLFSLKETASWKVVKTAWSALRIVEERPDDSRGVRSGALQPQDLEQVEPVLVVARPGDGKTTDMVELFAMRNTGPVVERTAISSIFAAELLRNEHLINTAFPEGFTDFNRAAWQADLPESLETLWDQLPETIKKNWSPGVDKLRAEHVEPEPFSINLLHPLDIDKRLQPNEGEEDAQPSIPRGSVGTLLPAAVAKFRGRSRWCAAGHPDALLADQPGLCSSCEFVACRANTSPGGAKTYWGQVEFPLLTHSAFRFRKFFGRDEDAFKTVVFDELPGFVYRLATIDMTIESRRGKRPQWRVEPLDSLDIFLQGVGGSDFINAVRTRIKSFREALCRLANERYAVAVKDGAKLRQHRLTQLKPLLTAALFSGLLKVFQTQGRHFDGDDDDTDAAKLVDAVLTLDDFSSDETTLPILIEDGFNKKITKDPREQKITVYRPVDGWSEIRSLKLHGPQVVILDATAGVDGRYLLAGQFPQEEYPALSVPNATVVITGKRTKSKLETLKPQQLADIVVDDVRPYRDRIKSGLLVLTNKSIEAELEPVLEPALRKAGLEFPVRLGHFGALRGRNELRDLDAVHFLNPYRYNLRWYRGLEMLLKNFKGAPTTWASTNSFTIDEALEARCIASDTYQDAMRIALRKVTSSSCTLFFPIRNMPALITRLAQLFQDATFVVDGVAMASSASFRAEAMSPPVTPQVELIEDEVDLPDTATATSWSGEQHQNFRQLIDGFFYRRACNDREAARLAQAFWLGFHDMADRLFVRHRGNEAAAWADAAQHLEPFLLKFQKADQT